MMDTVVITGGIGSGKSVVCRYLSGRGVPVYDADSAAKRLYSEDRGLVNSLVKALGDSILDAEGRLDRQNLARIIFSSKEALATVEAIVHPAVLSDFLKWKSERELEEWCGYSGLKPFVVMESAIVLEKRLFDGYYNAVVLVDAPDEIRLQRASERDGVDISAIAARMAAQKSDRMAADAIILNDSGLVELYEKTDIAFKTLYLHNRNKIKDNTMENIVKTDLTKILSVSGQHGLFRYIAQARNGAIVEALSDNKRFCFDMKSKITTLADISIYTDKGEEKLENVFLSLKKHLGDEEAPTSKSSPEELKNLFSKAVPNYDGDRFYVSHMKKVVDWYNELKKYASLDFAEETEVSEEKEDNKGEDQTNE